MSKKESYRSSGKWYGTQQTTQKCQDCGGSVLYDSSRKLRICSVCGLIQKERRGNTISFRNILESLKYKETIEEIAKYLDAEDWQIEQQVVLMARKGLVRLEGKKIIPTREGRRMLFKEIAKETEERM
ncbi:MAG: hypothetical protein ACUVXA_20580 [Candidatus Jordarchaeum sp.]|uniref:hypothetical protein n=1 Tax=Candidatus Jordarchaeum sp. TaxID=2823881 RepID=UPI00404B181E